MTGARSRRPAKARLIDAQAEKGLLAALRKADSAEEVQQLVRGALASEAELGEALWELAARGKLPLGNEAVVEVLSGSPPPSPEALVGMWTRAKPTWFARQKVQLPGVPSFLFYLAAAAIERDPQGWREAAPQLPEPLRAVVWISLAEHAPGTVPEEILSELRSLLLVEPFAPQMEMVIDNLRILGLDDAAIAEALLARLPENRRPRLAELEPLLLVASPAHLGAAMCAEEASTFDNKGFSRILRKRADSLAELIGLATLVRDRLAPDRSAISDQPPRLHPGHGLVQAILDVVLERAMAAGETVPGEVDALLTFWWEEQSYLAPALAALPRERLEAAIRRVLTRPAARGQRQRVFPAIRFAYSDALMAAALDEARSACLTTLSRMNAEPTSLGRIGLLALPALEQALEAALTDRTFPRESSRNRWLTQLRRAIAVALFEGTRQGQPVAERFDALLGPHPECGNSDIIAEVFASHQLFGKLLAGLPEPRARAIIGAWLEADRNDRLGVRELLERELPDEHHHLLGPAEPLIARLRRMVEETELPGDVRLYVLEPMAKLDPSSLNRVCGDLAGLAQERWPRHRGKRMEHVFTVDLNELPEVRARAGLAAEARDLALFVSSRSDNRAYSPSTQETALIPLSEAELAHGHGEEGGSFVVHALDVPSAVFRRGPRGPLGELLVALRQLPALALGPPFWIQEEAHSGDLLLQFGSSFAPMNLGDSGSMYVFPDAAFWQAY